MAYTEAGIVNLALAKIGEKYITTLTDATKQAQEANRVWEYIRNEVLEAKDWRFAKSTVSLSKVPPRVDLNCELGRHLIIQADRYLAATLEISIQIQTNTSDALSVAEAPTDTIQIKLASTTATKNTAALIQTAIRLLTINGVSCALWTVTANSEYTTTPATNIVTQTAVTMVAGPPADSGYTYAYYLPVDFLRIARQTKTNQLSLNGTIYSYAVETFIDGTPYLLTDYDDTTYALFITYIRKITDVTKFTAHFITALSFRLAAELAFTLTEGAGKFDRMVQLYEAALRKADMLNLSYDYLEDETGDDAWEQAGRANETTQTSN